MVGVEGLRLSSSGGIVEAVIDRGDENLFTVEMCQALASTLLAPPEGAHILHLRAEGSAFCLGRERVAVGAHALRAETDALVALNKAIAGSPLVTVAEVQGDAAGYGVGLAAICDISIAAPCAQFWFPEVRMDLAPAIVLAWLGRAVGRKQAFLLTATGEPIGARRAAELGLVTELAPDAAALGAAVASRLEHLGQYAAHVHTEIKRFLSVTECWSADDAYELAAVKLTHAGLSRQHAQMAATDG